MAADPSPRARTPYRIETDRLELRPWDPADVPVLTELVVRNHAHLKPWMPWAQVLPTVDEQLAVIRGFRARFDLDEDYVLGMFLAGSPVGGTGLRRAGPAAFEIGYWVDLGHQGQGLVTEATAAQCRVAFELLHAERIDITCDPRNTRSAAVPTRLGFRDEGVLRRRVVGVDGRLRDSRLFTLLAEDVPSSPVASTRIRAFDALGRQLL